MSIQKGQSAPDFKLFNSDKKELSLSDFKGKNLVILFFPQAFTGVCTTELCSVRDNLNVYTSLNAEVVGISVDSIFTLAKFKEEQQYNFPLLSDFNKTVSQAYGAFYEEFVFGMKVYRAEQPLLLIKMAPCNTQKCWRVPVICPTLMQSKRHCQA
ncbi:MAG: hypothetical protein RLZZ294_583 [Bacteroidota bacterium]